MAIRAFTSRGFSLTVTLILFLAKPKSNLVFQTDAVLICRNKSSIVKGLVQGATTAKKVEDGACRTRLDGTVG